MYARGCKGLPGWFGTLFFHVCTFDREGGEDLSDLGNAHIEPTHFKKGLPFPKNIPFSSILGTCKGLLGWFGAFFLHKFARRCKGLPGWFGTLFSTFDREGGGDLSDLGNAHIEPCRIVEPTHFKKGLPFNIITLKIHRATHINVTWTPGVTLALCSLFTICDWAHGIK